MANAKKQRIHYRLAPCPAYDVEKIESWLQDLAKEGWTLVKEGCVFGFLAFTKAAPQATQYRLEPKASEEGFGDVPAEDFQELCQEYGWEYVDTYGRFYIYRSTRPDAREMNTDLQVQAAALKAGKWQSRFTLVLDGILLLSVFSDFFVTPYLALAAFGLAFHVIQLVALIWSSIDLILQTLHLQRMHRKLKANIPLNHNKPWRQGAVFHRLGKIAYAVLILLLLGTLFGSCVKSIDEDLTPTSDYPGDPPFVTAADLYPEGEFTPVRFLSGYNAWHSYSSFFAPQVIEWKEYGQIVTPDGKHMEGSVIIDYYETRSPRFARGLLEDLYRAARENSHFSELTAPELDADYVVAYWNVYPTIMIQKGNILIVASISLEYEDEYQWQHWAHMMSRMLAAE